MRKLLNLIMLFSFFSYGQTYYGYKSHSNNSQKEITVSKISCNDLVKLIETKRRYLDVLFGGYNSETI